MIAASRWHWHTSEPRAGWRRDASKARRLPQQRKPTLPQRASPHAQRAEKEREAGNGTSVPHVATGAARGGRRHVGQYVNVRSVGEKRRQSAYSSTTKTCWTAGGIEKEELQEQSQHQVVRAKPIAGGKSKLNCSDDSQTSQEVRVSSWYKRSKRRTPVYKQAWKAESDTHAQ